MGLLSKGLTFGIILEKSFEGSQWEGEADSMRGLSIGVLCFVTFFNEVHF